MRCGHRDQHDLVLRQQAANAVNHPHSAQFEALFCGIDHRLDGLFGHAGVMLQLHRTHTLRIAVVTHRANECHHGTNTKIFSAQCGHFGAEIEVFGLNGDAWQ